MVRVTDIDFERQRIGNVGEGQGELGDAMARRWLTSFVVIGGGFSGVEPTGELYDFLRSSLRYYRNIRPEAVHVHLVRRGVHVHLQTRAVGVDANVPNRYPPFHQRRCPLSSSNLRLSVIGVPMSLSSVIAQRLAPRPSPNRRALRVPTGRRR